MTEVHSKVTAEDRLLYGIPRQDIPFHLPLHRLDHKCVAAQLLGLREDTPDNLPCNARQTNIQPL